MIWLVSIMSYGKLYSLKHQRVSMLGHQRQGTAIADIGAVKLSICGGEEGVRKAVFLDECVSCNPKDLRPDFSDSMLRGIIVRKQNALS